MIIKKNTHSPTRIPSPVIGVDSISYLVKFTPSCVYSIGIEQYDINKLFGVGYSPGHHTNSVRFGWRYLSGSHIEIFAYWYYMGVRGWDMIGSVEIGDCHVFTLARTQSSHTLTVETAGIQKTINIPARPLGYLLRPYFGGNTKAPHDIEILISKTAIQ